jgi:hypothetical protein
LAQILFAGQRISDSQFAGVDHLEQLGLYLKVHWGETAFIQRI